MFKQIRLLGALQRNLSLGLALTILSVGCTAPSDPTVTKQSIESESTQLSQSLDQQVSDDAPQLRAANHGHKDIPKGLEQNRYQSNRFGYSFIYPDGYDLTVTQADDSTEEYVTLLRMEDVGEPEPPFIGIQVYENPQQLSLEDFRNQKSYLIINEFPDIDVAGQRALDFEWAGLYEAREHLFKTPDGTHVVALNSTYLDVISDADPLWLDAQKIRDSFEWRSPSANSGNAANPDSFAIAQVQPFTFEELFEQEAGGCGMNLLQPNAAPGEGFLFTHGIDNAPALMKINGQWVELSRTEAKGEEFYGQYTSQTFVSEEDDITVQIDVQLGELGEIESVEFADVQFKVMQDNQVVEVTAIGGAGC